MKYRWEYDDRFPDDFDLEVQHESGDWHMIAFIRRYPVEKHYKCVFMGFDDNEYPDGETFKTKRGAKNFCVRHLPVMWIRHNTKGDDS
jgi:hypothetical protein